MGEARNIQVPRVKLGNQGLESNFLQEKKKYGDTKKFRVLCTAKYSHTKEGILQDIVSSTREEIKREQEWECYEMWNRRGRTCGINTQRGLKGLPVVGLMDIYNQRFSSADGNAYVIESSEETHDKARASYLVHIHAGTTKIKNLDINVGSMSLNLKEDDLKEICDAVPLNQIAGDKNYANASHVQWKFANTPQKTLG